MTDRRRSGERRSQARQLFRRGEERFRALLKHSSDVIFIIEADGTIAYVSPSVSRVLGYRPGDLVGTSLFECVQPDDRAGLWDTLAASGDPAARQDHEFHLRAADGAWRWVDARISDLLEEPTVRGRVLNCRDITERKETERALRETQDLFRTFLEMSPALAFVKDASGRYLSVNQRFERFFQVSLAEIQEEGAEFLPPEVAQRMQAVDRAVVLQQRPVELSAVIPDAEGRPRDWLILEFPIATSGAQPLLGGLALDVTAQRELEEQLRQAQKMEAVGRVAGGLAHDFNNLLTVINGFSELLLDRLAPDDRAREPLQEIRNAGGRGADLIRQLLAFSRRQVADPRLLDLRDTTAGLANMLRRMVREDIQVTVTTGPEPAVVLADPGQMEQVIVNLVLNARDAIPGRGAVTVEVRNVEMDEALARDDLSIAEGGAVLLSVTDTGQGMDAETQLRIFEPFFTTKEPGKGTGLGLATVYELVTQSGGRIRVQSEPGGGSAFRIYLPRAAGEPGGRTDSAPPGEIPHGTETVLLVEDQPVVRRLVAATLEACGYTVLAAGTGEEALRLAAGHEGPIHLLVTDAIMPGLSGRETAERLTRLRPEMRVLFLSAYPYEAVVGHGLPTAGAAFLEKPFTPIVLGQKIREALGSEVGK